MSKARRPPGLDQAERERRTFLRKFGRFAIATPPLITAMLSTSAKADFFSGVHCPPFPPIFCHEHGGGGGGKGGKGGGDEGDGDGG